MSDSSSSSAGNSSSTSTAGRRLAQALGAGLAGAAALSTARWWVQRDLPPPPSLPPAISAPTRTLEVPTGRVNTYLREGTGTPIVLLHSFNAAASPFEIRPIFERLAEATDRPLYALDWLGFGRSARPDIDYRPALYHDQLYRFLRTVVGEPVDLVGLSLSCEYAAHAALQTAPLVRRLALICPTGLSEKRGPSPLGKAGIRLADRIGAFELLFYRLTRRASLRDFYERQVFLDPTALPDELLDYAYVTSHARGAHRAPRRFVDGSLFLDCVIDEVYARLYRPTLVLTPKHPEDTVQGFDRLPALLDARSRDLTHHALPGGLLPHWEAPTPFFDVFLNWATS